MRTSADPVENLRNKVRAAVGEYDQAVSYHETWRIASNDKALHQRVSHSFAGNTFLVVRKALHRELLLSLARLWDTQTGTVKMYSIADDLEEPVILNSLWPDVPVYGEVRQTAADAANLIRQYEVGGSSHSILKSVRTLRNQHLAHGQINRKVIGIVDEDRLKKEVEILYEDSAKLITMLEHVVERTAYNPKETAGIYTFYAGFFWEAVRGERTEGHPRYRAAP